MPTATTGIAVTAAVSLLAAALAYGAWYYVDDLIRLLPQSPWRGFILGFRDVLSIIALFVVLTLAESITSRIARAFEKRGLSQTDET